MNTNSAHHNGLDQTELEIDTAPIQTPKQKELYWLAGGLVVVLLFIVAYKFNQPSVILPQNSLVPSAIAQVSPMVNTDSMANWKTYTNNQLGFSLRHPETYTIKEEIGIPKYILINNPNSAKDEIYVNLRIGKVTSGSDDYFNNYVKEVYNDGQKSTGKCLNATYTSLNSMTFADNPAYVFEQLNCDGDTMIYYVFNNKNIFYISNHRLERRINYQYQQSERVAKQILSTFKFMDSKVIRTSPTPTASILPIEIVDTTPPIITIGGGPMNGETVTFHNFCFPMTVVDDVSKNNTINVQTKLDSQAWSGWSTNVGPCYNNVSNGSHTFSVQAKDEAGNVSSIITRNFTIIEPITITLSGQIYRDSNCNAAKDSGEYGISGVSVSIYQRPQYYLIGTVNSDQSGNYSYSKTIELGETYVLSSSAVAPSGYKSNPNYIEPDKTLNSSNNSATIDIPKVPNENVGSCQ